MMQNPADAYPTIVASQRFAERESMCLHAPHYNMKYWTFWSKPSPVKFFLEEGDFW